MTNLETLLQNLETRAKNSYSEADMKSWYRPFKITHVLQLIEIIRVQKEALEEAIEHMSSNLEDMQMYFENKCIPTMDEVNQVAISDSGIRYAIAKVEEIAGGKL